MARATAAAVAEVGTVGDRFAQVFLGQLVESAMNPRRVFDAVKLEELAESIRQKGIIEPLVVRPVPGPASQREADFEIVAGARRFRAAKVAELDRVPCVIRDYSDEDVLELFLIENVQRDDLAPLEQARGFKQLLEANPDKYSAATIATKVGMSPGWVWDRLKLLDLVPEAQTLLETGRIGIGHAIILARLKPEHQEKAIDTDSGGLWTDAGETLNLDDASYDKDPYQDVKPVTVRELEAWIAQHVRFDVAHAAEAVPLEFGEVAARVDAAAAKPGRGKKVVSITYEHHVQADARGDERVYTEQSWRRADGSTVRDDWDGKDRVASTCEHAVLGLVVVGRHYGRAFDVCIAKDSCRIHWGDEIDRRAKDQKARDKQAANGKPSDAGTRAVDAKRKDDEKRAREQAERAAWDKLEPLLEADLFVQARTVTKLPATIGRFVDESDAWDTTATMKKALGADWHKKPAAAWMVMAVRGIHADSFEDYVKQATTLGLNVKRLTAIRDAHAAPAKKANAKKPAKRR